MCMYVCLESDNLINKMHSIDVMTSLKSSEGHFGLREYNILINKKAWNIKYYVLMKESYIIRG